jgi:hypothetical protein
MGECGMLKMEQDHELRVTGLSMIAVFISAFAFFIEKTKDMVILT